MGTLPVLPASPLGRFRDLLPTTQKAIHTQYSAGCKLLMYDDDDDDEFSKHYIIQGWIFRISGLCRVSRCRLRVGFEVQGLACWS